MSVGYVTGTERFRPFEAAGSDYNPPIADDIFYRVKTGDDMNKEKRRNFADLEAKRMSFVPGPSKYMTQPDWRKNIKGKRGKFLKKERRTFTESVMKYEKKKPAPSKYYNKEALKEQDPRPLGNYT